jgi:hypothetical protein
MTDTINVKDYCDCLRKHIVAQQAMQDTYGRVQMVAEAKECEAFIDGLRRAIEVAANMAERRP